jgi:hypothetical protein
MMQLDGDPDRGFDEAFSELNFRAPGSESGQFVKKTVPHKVV